MTNRNELQSVITGNGTSLTSVNLFSIDDLQRLEEISVVGKKQNVVVVANLYPGGIKFVTVARTEVCSIAQQHNLNLILTKYLTIKA